MPRAKALAFVALLITLLSLIVCASAAYAQVAERQMERRVTAIPESELLSRTPDKLVDEHRQAAAHQLVSLTRPAWFLWIALQLFALFYLWASGTAARSRDTLKRSIRSTALVRFIFGAALTAVVQLVALPAEFFDYRVLRVMGLSSQTTGSWFSDIVITALLEMVVIGIIVVVVLWLVDRTHLWWVYVAGLIFGLTFLLSYVFPIAIEPIFNHFAPLPANRPLTAQIEALAKRAGEGNLPIYVSDLSRRTHAGNAYVVGIGPSRRIVVGDTLLNSATDREILFIVAHELGHDVHGDTFRGALFGGILFVVAAALSVLIADRVGFRRDDDPLSRLTLVGAILGCIYLLFLPLANGYSRQIEASADAYALQLTHDRAAGARAFVRFADEDLALICPSRFARLYWYTHPPLGTRITNLNGQPNPCP
ncbi:MAG: M48 family metalloprotease [Candidatus Eremiobacteraeota bacterium]|nr:M48 family metalloprotease [Candidatus Eremiobacteraeota bacterium]